MSTCSSAAPTSADLACAIISSRSSVRSYSCSRIAQRSSRQHRRGQRNAASGHSTSLHVKTQGADDKPEPPVPERPSHTHLPHRHPGARALELQRYRPDHHADRLQAARRACKCTVTELLTPQKDRLLQPSSPSRCERAPLWHADRTHRRHHLCAQLTPPLPEFNEELYRVLTEALALADADDPRP